MENKTIAFRSITKVYPPDIVAVDNINLSIDCGKVTSIIGENGAGKSTLMKILYGLESPSIGEIFFDDKKVNISSPEDAIKHGIGMVHQEFMLVNGYTAAENIVLGSEPKKWLNYFDKKKANKITSELFEKYEIDIKAESIVGNLSIAGRQKIEIAKLLYRNVKILILDEPTAVLTPQESKTLFNQIKLLRDAGNTALFISHKLDEVLEVSDNIVVMRKGKLIDSHVNKNITKEILATSMIGRPMLFHIEKNKTTPGKTVLDVQNLVSTNGEKGVKNISFSVRQGEIVGIAGVEGNGQLELVEAITGQKKAQSGKITLNEDDITNLPIDKKRAKISYVSQDRKNIGSAQNLSLIDNCLMTHHKVNKNVEGKISFFIDYKKVNKLIENIVSRFQVVAKSAKTEIGALSGGNQQKFIIGREFMLETNFALLDQPTRGLDILSIEYIHKEIIRKKENGAAILLISAELEEILSLSDRVIILYKGEIVGEKIAKKTTAEELGKYMLGLARDIK